MHVSVGARKGEADSGLRARVYLGHFMGEKGFVGEREGQMLHSACPREWRRSSDTHLESR